MSHFFIRRPIFAWVIGILITLLGLVSITQLAVERFPSVSQPQVDVFFSYQGASPETINDTVISIIERELFGTDGIESFTSSSDSTGNGQISVKFAYGTDPELAQIAVQNKIKTVEPRLPQDVRQSGLNVESSSSSDLMYLSVYSKSGKMTEGALSDFLARNVTDEIKRIPGVGKVTVYSAEHAMRIWVDPQKLVSYDLTMSDVTGAISAQNVQIASGQVGQEPAKVGQKTVTPLTASGQLKNVKEFENIILRSSTDGKQLRLKDVARVELGQESYNFGSRINSKSSASIGIKMMSGANAVATSNRIHARMKELKKIFPEDIDYMASGDAAPFAKISIQKVVKTLVEAMILVFIVMYLFLQRFTYTFIPAIVAPIALCGAFVIMKLMGFSINVFTMFGIVLSIGIIVDDAIIVVENVERLMAKEGLSPLEATKKAMKEISGAVIGVTAVMVAVFVPISFASGTSGQIYQQFALSIAVAILFSAFLALTLTPALCATMLKPIKEDAHKRTGLLGWFNRAIESSTQRYGSLVAKTTNKTMRMMGIYLVLSVGAVYMFQQLNSTFFPEEDQGYFFSSIQLPADASRERTLEVVSIAEKFLLAQPEVRASNVVLGFSFAGSGSGSALMITDLVEWDKRERSSADIANAFNAYMSEHSNDGVVFAALPPAIQGLGATNGVSFQLQDRANRSAADFEQLKQKFNQALTDRPEVTGLFYNATPYTVGLALDIDREKAMTLGVSFSDISETLSTAMGSNYVNDFPNHGRMQKVIVQADQKYRMNIEDVLGIAVKNSSGKLVYLSELIKADWQSMPQQLTRYNGMQAADTSAMAAQGYSSGQVMNAVLEVASQVDDSVSIEWTNLSKQERQAESEVEILLLFSLLVVFLVLAALYESWTIPIAVVLVAPLGLLGSAWAVSLSGLQNDMFFKVGLIALIGLSAKNAILIVEFANQQRKLGLSVAEAAIQAAKLRLRPILMTSLAFTFGIVPLMFASGASSEIQNSLGTGVFGGMVSGTLLALLFVPTFFVFVNKLTKTKR